MPRGKAKVKTRVRIRLQKGDLVQVMRASGRVLVQGVGTIKRHTKPNPQRNIKGGIAEREGPIHASNVMIISPEDDRPTRIAATLLADGRKVRVAARGRGVLDK